MANNKYKLSPKTKAKILVAKKYNLANQQKITARANQLTNQVVVVRTFIGTFIGCIVDVIRGAILLRVFSGVNRKFIVIRIPVILIFDIFPFRCF